jgi:hypothetical protein
VQLLSTTVSGSKKKEEEAIFNMLERVRITPVKQAELYRRFEMEILRVLEIR